MPLIEVLPHVQDIAGRAADPLGWQSRGSLLASLEKVRPA